LWLKDIDEFEQAWKETKRGQEIKRHKDTTRINQATKDTKPKNTKRKR
jgi:hypothetical protein